MLQRHIENGIPVRHLNISLQNADLSGLNLMNADFSGANLQGAIFTKTKLQKANFSHANVSQTNFEWASLNKANFKQADLTSSNLTNATVDGALFKGATLLNARIAETKSAKGTLLVDKESLSRKIEKENKVNFIKEEFLRKSTPNVIRFQENDSLQTFLPRLREKLATMKSSHAVIDFSTPSSDLLQECIGFLKSPHFRPFVMDTASVCDNAALIIFLNAAKKNLNTEEGNCSKNPRKKKIDLHGEITSETKKIWIDEFVERSYRHSLGTIEIITGRGLHNPEGKMGQQWRWCERYLLSRKFKSYVKDIVSINKDGGWRILLKYKTIKGFDKHKDLGKRTGLYYYPKDPIKKPPFARSNFSTSTYIYTPGVTINIPTITRLASKKNISTKKPVTKTVVASKKNAPKSVVTNTTKKTGKKMSKFIAKKPTSKNPKKTGGKKPHRNSGNK